MEFKAIELLSNLVRLSNQSAQSQCRSRSRVRKVSDDWSLQHHGNTYDDQGDDDGPEIDMNKMIEITRARLRTRNQKRLQLQHSQKKATHKRGMQIHQSGNIYPSGNNPSSDDNKRPRIRQRYIQPAIDHSQSRHINRVVDGALVNLPLQRQSQPLQSDSHQSHQSQSQSHQSQSHQSRESQSRPQQSQSQSHQSQSQSHQSQSLSTQSQSQSQQSQSQSQQAQQRSTLLDLNRISLLDANHARFQQWCFLYGSHNYCCNKKAWPAEASIERILFSKENPSKAHTNSQVNAFVGKIDMKNFKRRSQHIHICEIESSITQSLCWNSSRLKSSLTASSPQTETLYVNFTNLFLPGYGFTGHAPQAQFKIDDVDELNVFWNSDISLFLQPQHPTVLQQCLFPLKTDEMLFCPHVSIYAPHESGSVCKTRDIAVLTVPLDTVNLVKQNSDNATTSESQQQQRRQLHLIFKNILQTCTAKQAKHVIVPLGRLMRLKFEPLVVAHCFCQVFLPAMKQNQLKTIELLVTNKSIPTNQWVHNLFSVVNTYIEK